jgi:hypothetical protein
LKIARIIHALRLCQSAQKYFNVPAAAVLCHQVVIGAAQNHDSQAAVCSSKPSRERYAHLTQLCSIYLLLFMHSRLMNN